MKKAFIENAIDSRAKKLTALSDRIWEYAETAFVEFKSTADLCAALEEEGFKVEKNVAGIETAFTGTYGSGKPVIGFLGEYDALFNLSQKGCCATRDPLVAGANGHGCGHNLLGVGSLAAAIAVKDYLKETGKSGTVIFYGTPGEEGGSGKAFMAREGVFNGLDAAITWHPAGLNYPRMASSLANIQVAFKFKGIAAHAAGAPHKGRSALDAVELTNVGVNYMREHIMSDCRVHYAVTNSGGSSPNVVQPTAEVLYLCRAPRIDDAQKIYEWVCDIARGAAMMTQTELEIDFYKAASNVIANRPLAELSNQNMNLFGAPQLTEEEMKLVEELAATYTIDFARDAKSMVNSSGKEFSKAFAAHAGELFCQYVLPVPENESVGMGSTDVGDVSWCCPTINLNIATHGYGVPGHSWQHTASNVASFAHKGMLYAGKTMAGTAIDIIDNPELLKPMWEEFKERVGDGYVCPIPKGVKPRPIK